MITFSCAHCGLKLQIGNEAAGKQARCPTCRSLVAVPNLSAAIPAPESVDGQASSLDKAGLAGLVTLPSRDSKLIGPKSGTKPAGKPTSPSSVRDVLGTKRAGGQRYVVESEIARGGMGAVLRAVDCDIRREVAVKYMLNPGDPKKKTRFIEEVQITGQLEHPNIVPIHDLGVDNQGRLFFTMKLVRGRSLKELLDEIRAAPAKPRYSLPWLLNAVVSVCNALAYAHARGVVHRDLKPANIMLGDFGEVYVMDWGLAKVVGSEQAGDGSFVTGPIVATSRPDDLDVTVDGAIMGTPVYMPPEQAAGRANEIDARSDIYSLGAILYEILTLAPPVEKKDGNIVTLMQVIQGNILPPAQRAPERARKGKIPSELSAVAMKALQKKREDRYPAIETFRRDIERFLEGKAVSVKGDSIRESVWKLARRHPGASVTTVLASVLLLVLLIVSVRVNYQARVQAERAYAEKQLQAKQSVPAFVMAARLFAKQKNVEAALAQVNTALQFDADNPEAHLLKGELLVVQQQFPAAQRELERYLQAKPNDTAAAALARLCAEKHPEGALLQVADQLSRLDMSELADLMSLNSQQRLEFIRQRLKTGYGLIPGQYVLSMDTAGRIHLSLNGQAAVKDLKPLQGLSISHLALINTPIESVAPLADMPLLSLNINGCKVRDIGPLRGLRLTSLGVSFCQAVDWAILREMPLTSLDATNTNLRDLNELRGLPLRSLNISLNPFKDLSPLRGCKLTALSMSGCQGVQDFSALKSIPFTELTVSNCSGFKDLSVVQGHDIRALYLANTPIADLGPLKGMPLVSLWLDSCTKIVSLAPLQGSKVLRELDIRGTGIDDLSDLQGLPLDTLLVTSKRIKRGWDAVRGIRSLARVDVLWPSQRTPSEFWKKLDDGTLER